MDRMSLLINTGLYAQFKVPRSLDATCWLCWFMFVIMGSYMCITDSDVTRWENRLLLKRKPDF